MDDGNPTSTGSIGAALRLCDILGICLQLDPPEFYYSRGWGCQGLGASPVICCWTIAVQDINGRVTYITFDLFDDDSPLIIGLDLIRYGISDFVSVQLTLTFKRPTDDHMRCLPIYITSPNSVQARAHVELLFNTSCTLMATGSNFSRPLALAKRLHRFIHAPAHELTRLIRRAGHENPDLEKAISDVGNACEPCARSGPPLPSKKLSLSKVNVAFNQFLQADFMFCQIRGRKHCVLHAVDAATSFYETIIVQSRSAVVMAAALESIWIIRHGAPTRFASDYEFQTTPMRRFLTSHNIYLDERPVRRHNKSGTVERNHLTIKRVLERIQFDESSATDAALMARATFLSNVFSGSRKLSSFEIVKGYTLSILGLPPSLVSADLLEAYKDQAATRALQRLLSSRAPSTIPPSSLPPGTRVFFFFKSSKQCDPIEWRPATVISAEPHLVRVKAPSGRTSSVAYEYIRLRPKTDLASQLMEGSVEDATVLPEGGESKPSPDTLVASGSKDISNTMLASSPALRITDEAPLDIPTPP